jgi:uncharacterized circularly permuted ATP-grasp superfamily protein
VSASAYPLEPDCFDEAFEAEGTPRAHYAPLLEALEGQNLRQLRERSRRGSSSTASPSDRANRSPSTRCRG